MYESSKAVARRLHDVRFATRYFVGNGMDIGAGNDSLAQYVEQFPLMRSCRGWDVKDGDAELLATVADSSLDFAHSSHCLEHMRNPDIALGHWLRVIKPGGHLVVVIPDEDLYEGGVFPSTYNPDHKWTFTVCKPASWSPKSINLFDLLRKFAGQAQVLKIEQLDASYRFGMPRVDQTQTMIGECAIEFVLRKWTPSEITARGRLPAPFKPAPAPAPKPAAPPAVAPNTVYVRRRAPK